MATAEESTRAIGRAKAAIDNGFSRIGRTLSGDDAVAGWLHAAGGRAVALCDALILLCKEHHAPEAAPLARAVLQLAADTRWVAAGHSLDRLAELQRESENQDWGPLWSESRLKERLVGAGLPEAQAHEWLQTSARLCVAQAAGGSSGLPWAHAFGAAKPRLSAEEALGSTVRAMDEIVRALNERWPGYFTL